MTQKEAEFLFDLFNTRPDKFHITIFQHGLKQNVLYITQPEEDIVVITPHMIENLKDIELEDLKLYVEIPFEFVKNMLKP